MNIEVAEPGRMTQTGSSLLRLIQNNNMPILDLLVRESIQNSLDAKDSSNTKYVEVEFLTGEFDKNSLNQEFDGIEKSLNKKFEKKENRYIAVRDYHTVGLTGKLHYQDVEDNQYGNLLKLVYEISKPQENEGSGGSWGLGKTVYFRVGVGLVIYYSKIINEDGQEESRLAASLVEDENDDNSLIPAFNGKYKRGIAWWGKEIEDNKTIPITDTEYIKKFLQIFGIDPYKADETGTTIIIPYIDTEKLLENNQTTYFDAEENEVHFSWQNTIEEYIKIAVQRWYCPRLNNIYYPHSKFLRAKINGRQLSFDDMEPLFKVIQYLYNRALGVDSDYDALENDDIAIKNETIELRKVLKKSAAGYVAFTKINRKILKMNYPDNKPNPFAYINCDIPNSDTNKPILCFTRKPGMIVSYEEIGKWVDGISETPNEEYIIAIFVLNSENDLVDTSPVLSLEEYIRKSEMADHTSWNDYSVNKTNPRIVNKIQNSVVRKISKEFSVNDEDNTSKLNSGLGKLFGDLLLPPENFGKKPSPITKNIKNIKQVEKHNDVSLMFDPSLNKYSSAGLRLTFDIKSKNKISKTGLVLSIESETGNITFNEWENKMGLKKPFEIIESNVEIVTVNDNKVNDIVSASIYEPCKRNDYCTVELLKDNTTALHQLNIEMSQPAIVELKITVHLLLCRRDIKPVFKLQKGDNE